MKRALILAGLIVASITLILVIAPEQSTNTKSSQVAATIFPIYDITKNVVGNTMDVALIVPSGASPHTFEPAPSTLRDLAQTEVVFSIGHGLDDWTDNLVLSIGAQNITVDSNIDLLDASAENISDPQNSYNGLSNVDPHYWLSIQNAKIITQTIADDLSLRFPEFAVEIAINKSNYLEELNKAEQEIIVMLNQVQNKNLLTLHNAWYYFADAYDLSIVGTFEPTAGREPTPQYLVQLMEAIEKSGSKTLYSEPQLATLSLESFLIDNDLSLSELDPIGGVSGRESYIKLMLYNANVISQNQ